MADISLTAINQGDLCQASVVENNFTAIEDLLSGKLDSANYAESSVYSQHISANAIVNAKISDSQVQGQHIATRQIVEPKVEFASGGGLRCIRIGAASNSMPANGVQIIRVTASTSITSAAAASDATYGLPLWGNLDGLNGYWAEQPTFGEPGVYIDTATYSHSDVIGSNWAGPNQIDVLSNAAGLQSIRLNYNRTIASDATHVVTVHVCMKGPY